MWLRYRILRLPAVAISKMPVYRLKWSGSVNAPVSGPFIIVANHQTSIDGLAIAIALKKAAGKSPILPWAKRDIGRGREGIVGFILWRIFGKITIDRGAEKEAPNAIRKSLEQLRKMKIVLIFPEGTRYPQGEIGPFKYGVANLARATPAPILPVAVYRRDDDNGVQVNIGYPFFMPDIPLDVEEVGQPRSKIEALLIKQLEIAREWGESVGQDKKGMKLLARLIDLITRMINRQQTSFNLLFRMARPEDNEFLRARVLELLPDDWRAVEGPSSRDRGMQNVIFRE